MSWIAISLGLAGAFFLGFAAAVLVGEAVARVGDERAVSRRVYAFNAAVAFALLFIGVAAGVVLGRLA